MTELQDAIKELSNLINNYPFYASGYNNRAQARRLLYPDLDTLVQDPEATHAILQDLGQAISIATPLQATGAVSHQDARVLSSAHTHRAYLLYKCSQMSESKGNLFAAIPQLGQHDGETLLEMASRDFALGGRYGNKVAKQLAVHTNPYAKLCGSIVKEALQKEFDEYAAGKLVS